MNNMEHDKQVRMLKEAEAFLEKLSLTSEVEAFLAGETVDKIIRNTFQVLMKAVGEIVDATPDSIKEIAKEIAEGLAKNEDGFATDVKATFKLNLAKTLKSLADYIAVDTMVRTMVVEVLKTDKEGKLHELINHMSMMLAAHAQEDVMECIYSNYVPEGMPEEVADFITNVLGGGSVMLPFEAVFPGFGKDDDDDDEEEGSEGCECACGDSCECKKGHCNCNDHE